MNIPTELRQAILAFCRYKNTNREDIYALRRLACAELFKNHPNARKALRRSKRLAERVQKLQDIRRTIMAEYGLDEDGDYIRNEQVFSKFAELPQAKKVPRFEHLMAMLLMSNNEEGAALLRKWGIRWEGITHSIPLKFVHPKVRESVKRDFFRKHHPAPVFPKA